MNLFEVTIDEVDHEKLKLLQLKDSETLIDLGCGDVHQPAQVRRVKERLQRRPRPKWADGGHGGARKQQQHDDEVERKK